MQVMSLLTLPSSIPLTMLSGQYGQQGVLEELNSMWRNSGSGVIFGTDSFSERFAAFSSMLGEKINTVKETVLKAVEKVCCPNKFQEIICEDDLRHVPVCMYIPILTDPNIRPVFESGKIRGWDVDIKDLPEEDVYGRLIKNGRFNTGDLDYDRNAPLTWTFHSDDPNLSREQLDMIEDARGFCSTFLNDQLNGDMLDFTDLPNHMGQLRKL